MRSHKEAFLLNFSKLTILPSITLIFEGLRFNSLFSEDFFLDNILSVRVRHINILKKALQASKKANHLSFDLRRNECSI